MNKQELKNRQRYCGGTDIAGILGISQWKTPLEIWNDKVNGSDFKGNIHTEFGKQMEEPVAKWFKKKFEKQYNCKIKLEKPPALYHPKHEIFIAHLDRIMTVTSDKPIEIDGVVIEPNVPIIIEIKTAGQQEYKNWQEDKLPDDYYCQIQHYYNVTGLEHSFIVALVGKHLQWKYIPRNQEFINGYTPQIVEWWNTFVIPQIPPDASGTDGDKKLIGRWYDKVFMERCIDIENEDMAMYKDLKNQYKTMKETTDTLDKQIKTFEQNILLKMGNSQFAKINQKYIAERKEIMRNAFSVPEGKYIKFNLKEIKGEN